MRTRQQYSEYVESQSPGAAHPPTSASASVAPGQPPGQPLSQPAANSNAVASQLPIASRSKPQPSPPLQPPGGFSSPQPPPLPKNPPPSLDGDKPPPRPSSPPLEKHPTTLPTRSLTLHAYPTTRTNAPAMKRTNSFSSGSPALPANGNGEPAPGTSATDPQATAPPPGAESESGQPPASADKLSSAQTSLTAPAGGPERPPQRSHGNKGLERGAEVGRWGAKLG